MKKEIVIAKIAKIIKETPTAWATPLINDLEEKQIHLAIQWVLHIVKYKIPNSFSIILNDYINIIEKVINEKQIFSPEKIMEHSRRIFLLNESKDIFVSNLSNLYACEAHYLSNRYDKYVKNLNYIAMTLNFDEVNNKFIDYLNEDCLYAIDTYLNMV